MFINFIISENNLRAKLKPQKAHFFTFAAQRAAVKEHSVSCTAGLATKRRNSKNYFRVCKEMVWL